MMLVYPIWYVTACHHYFMSKTDREIENKNVKNLINKTCLIGLNYINTNGDLLKQAQYAGTVITVDKEEGITVKLDSIESAEKGKKTDSGSKGTPNFHIPASLDAWFIALNGHY